jgi:hypothetical protein
VSWPVILRRRLELLANPFPDNLNTMNTVAPTTKDLIGTYRTFGPYGPLYKVVGKVGDNRVHVIVIESGEELDYPIDRALEDPEAE